MRNYWYYDPMILTHRLKMFGVLSVGLVLFFSAMPRAGAYTDEILTTKEEVMNAARKALEPFGIGRDDADGGILESHWIEDEIQRTKRIFPSQSGLDPEVNQTVLRKYRLRIKVSEKEEATRVEIRGTFREKSRGTTPAIPWRRVDPTSEDFRVEQQFFFKILEEMQKARLLRSREAEQVS